MFSSPKRDNYKDLLKSTNIVRDADILYMPSWSEKELLDCQRLIFHKVPPSRVKELYAIWGGVPRTVLDNAFRFPSSLKALKGLVDQASLPSLLEAAGAMDMADTNSHRLLHMRVSEDFELQGVTFASRRIADKVVVKAAIKRRHTILDFLNASRDRSDLGSMCGTVFEALAHSLLQEGGLFLQRQASGRKVRRLSLPPSATPHFFRAINDIPVDVPDSAYLRPEASNFEAVDSFRRRPCELFQMTVSTSKVVSGENLLKVLRALDPTNTMQSYQFYFVVPDYVFPKFKATLPGVRCTQLAKVAYNVLSIPVAGYNKQNLHDSQARRRLWLYAASEHVRRRADPPPRSPCVQESTDEKENASHSEARPLPQPPPRMCVHDCAREATAFHA
jgi:hypothetical protein